MKFQITEWYSIKICYKCICTRSVAIHDVYTRGELLHMYMHGESCYTCICTGRVAIHDVYTWGELLFMMYIHRESRYTCICTGRVDIFYHTRLALCYFMSYMCNKCPQFGRKAGSLEV